MVSEFRGGGGVESPNAPPPRYATDFMNPICVFVPTSIPFHKKRMESELFRYVPEGTVPMISSGGFINMGIFFEGEAEK